MFGLKSLRRMIKTYFSAAEIIKERKQTLRQAYKNHPDETEGDICLGPYLKLVQALEEYHHKIIDDCEQRIKGIASTGLVLTIVGYIPSCIGTISLLGQRTDSDGDYYQEIVAGLLVFLSIWCTIAFLSYIAWYRIIPQFSSSLVRSLLRRHKANHLPSIQEFETDTVGEKSFSKFNCGMSLVRQANRVASWMVLFLRMLPLFDILHSALFPLNMLAHLAILVVVYKHVDDSEVNDMVGICQFVFTGWLFVLNVIFAICSASPSPRRSDSNGESDDEEEPSSGHGSSNRLLS